MIGSQEKIRPTPHEVGTAQALKRAVNGEPVNGRFGDWVIADVHYPKGIQMFYVTEIDGKDSLVVDYIFTIPPVATTSPIIFNNAHRESAVKRKGYGTRSLLSLESALQILGDDLERDISLRFTVGDQDDTKAWLTERGYASEESSLDHGKIIFSKDFTQ